MNAFLAIGVGSLCFCLAAVANPVFKVLRDDQRITQLIENGGFENLEQGRPIAWRGAPNGYIAASGEGHSSFHALFCDNTNSASWSGVSQTIQLNRSNAFPLRVSGWSKASDVSGSADSGYSLYVDITYVDGSPLWGQTANFRCGTHDWQQRELLITPAKPIRSLTIYCILRGHTGKAWFDGISLRELTRDNEGIMLDGLPVTQGGPAGIREPAETPAKTYKTTDGLELVMRNESVKSLRAQKQGLGANIDSGFMVRDVAANSDFQGFRSGACPELGLTLQAECVAAEDHLKIRGKISSTSARDRAVTLYFTLPVAASGWFWGDDVRRNRLMDTRAEFSKTTPVGCGANGTMSLYPFAAIWNRRHGLGLGLDMDKPAQFRLACNPGAQNFYIAYDFGLSPETRHFPNSAEFSFVIFRFDPEWGFRAALDKFIHIFPEHFRVRSHDQGIWMPFTDVATVQGGEDFGFKYHEGVNNVSWDDAHGILSFRYTEPMTWWMAMKPTIPRTTPNAVQIRDQLAAGSNDHQAQIAQVSKVAGMWDEAGEPAVLFRDTPWCNGVVWSLNPNPYLSVPQGSLNAAGIYWNDAVKETLYGPGARNAQDGEYLDSLEGYVTADLNFKREHFQNTTVPLTFASDSREPALFKGLAIYEFTRWLSEDVHRLGKLMFANGVPYRFSFLCPWLDVMGTETDWVREGKYAPSTDEQLCYWRAMSGQKPYLLLMNTDFNIFTIDMVEKYFQRSLFFGMYPSMFSHNAADNPYWQNPKLYNRDRELFKKYIPLIRKVSTAGWEPVTLCTCDNPRIYVERFGANASSTVYFSLLNDTAQEQSGRFKIDWKTLGIGRKPVASELVSGLPLDEQDGFAVTLPPQQARIIRITSRP